jgi:TPR repeat protein
MSYLEYKTRNDILPHGLSKIYICCTEEDGALYVKKIASQILKLNNSSVWYKTKNIPADEMQEHLDSLMQMQLFVMPVTKKLLTQPNQALDVEFRFAIDNNIPVLPLMQEPYLVELFNKKCGEIQFLDETQADSTALSYFDKLEKYLDAVLLSDNVAAQVRNAFDAYIFMSYRKKDRKYAQQLMNMIHRNPQYRGLAIWYDEFLVPGEDFNQNIKTALKKSILVTLAVTPNVLESDNYIISTEYPEMCKESKPVIPFEMTTTDIKTLKTLFNNIPDCVNPYDHNALEMALSKHLKKIALSSDSSPEHTFLIGLAYLEGIDVEKDYEYALEMITQAAEAQLPEAMEKLVSMYGKGQGVKQDNQKVCYWQDRLIKARLALFEKQPSIENGIEALRDMNAHADYLQLIGETEQSASYYNQMVDLSEALFKIGESIELTLLYSNALNGIGDFLQENEDFVYAMNYYEYSKDAILKEFARQKIKTDNEFVFEIPKDVNAQMIYLLSNYIVCRFNLNDVLFKLAYAERSTQKMGEVENTLDMLKKTLLNDEIAKRIPNYQRMISMLYSRLGDFMRSTCKFTQAKEYYEKALDIDRARLLTALEAHDINVLDDYAISCYDLANADPEHIDVNYLKDACAISIWLKEKLPHMPIYSERVQALEEMILKEEPGFSFASLSIQRVIEKQSEPKPKQEQVNKTPITKTHQNSSGKMRPSPKIMAFLENLAESVERFENEKKLEHETNLSKAREGDIPSIVKVFKDYLNGNGTPKDEKQAAYWAKKAKKAYYDISLEYDKAGYKKEAKKFLILAARRNDDYACFDLSLHYRKGYGELYKKNAFLAWYWTKRKIWARFLKRSKKKVLKKLFKKKQK